MIVVELVNLYNNTNMSDIKKLIIIVIIFLPAIAIGGYELYNDIKDRRACRPVDVGRKPEYFPYDEIKRHAFDNEYDNVIRYNRNDNNSHYDDSRIDELKDEIESLEDEIRKLKKELN